MKKIIQDNIYDFYDEIGYALKTGFFKDPTISWMNTGSGSWPNMIYNTSFSEEKLEDFVSVNTAAIKTKKAIRNYYVNRCILLGCISITNFVYG